MNINELNLFHWNKEPVTLEVRKYTQGSANTKPLGFWFDVDMDWWRWCDGENFDEEGRLVCQPVRLVKPETILWLKNASDIDQFTDAYRRQKSDSSYRVIDWERVAGRYLGLIIAPYCWERRLEGNARWYYVWDCASGCVWDTSVIEIDAPIEADSSRLVHQQE